MPDGLRARAEICGSSWSSSRPAGEPWSHEAERRSRRRLGWIGAYPTADAFLTPLFQSGMRDNITGFTNAQVDGTLKNGRAEADEAQ